MVADVIAQNQTLLIQFAIFISALVALAITSNWVVIASERISRILRISQLLIGFVFIAVITSLPELAVSASAMIEGATAISIGNLIGSNIANIALVIGLAAIIFPLIIRRGLLGNLSTILFITSLFPLILVNVPGTSRIIGFILMVIFFIFIVNSLKAKAPFPAIPVEPIPIERKVRQFIYLALSLMGVLISAQFIVTSGVQIATELGIAQTILGATIIAVGTSVPELAVSLTAVAKKRYDLALGNVLGSCITNIGLILGLLLFIAPFTLELYPFSNLVTFLIGTNIVLWYFIVNGKISRLSGVALLLIYVLFLIASFFTGYLVPAS